MAIDEFGREIQTPFTNRDGASLSSTGGVLLSTSSTATGGTPGGLTTTVVAGAATGAQAEYGMAGTQPQSQASSSIQPPPPPPYHYNSHTNNRNEERWGSHRNGGGGGGGRRGGYGSAYGGGGGGGGGGNPFSLLPPTTTTVGGGISGNSITAMLSRPLQTPPTRRHGGGGGPLGVTNTTTTNTSGTQHRYGGGGGGGGQGGTTGTTNTTNSTAGPALMTNNIISNHPSLQYVEQPLLCEYVWKEQQPELSMDNKKSDLSDDTNNDNNNNNNRPNTDDGHEADGVDTPNEAEDEATIRTDNNGTTGKTVSPYEVYRREYCLKYIRAFFNQHLDDVWFRARYSPAQRLRGIEHERERALTEALELFRQAQKSPADFVAGARLGYGQKLMSGGTSSNTGSQSSTTTTGATATPAPSVPPSHLFSWQSPFHDTQALLVKEIAPRVTTDQLLLSLMSLCAGNYKPSQMTIQVYDTTVLPTTGRNTLQRQAVVVGSATIITDIWKTLSGISAAVPRKDEEELTYDLEVDCTDPYGRFEYDADGRGGPPTDGIAVPLKKSIVAIQKIPRKAPITVLSAAVSVSTRHAQDAQSAQMLAMQWDEIRQIPTDRNCSAVLQVLGLHQDSDKNVDASNRLDVCIAYLRRVHLLAFCNTCDQPSVSVGDIMAGKHFASTIHLRLQNADEKLQELTPTVPASHRVDDEEDNTAATTRNEPPLDQSEENVTGGSRNEKATTSVIPSLQKDLLVQRLENSIEAALRSVRDYMNDTPTAVSTDDASSSLDTCRHVFKMVPSPAIIQEAEAIASAEEQARDQWLADHSIIDEDQRARCSFHFCHKLFKDTSFLHKHLLKKHAEFLTAEQAKCHDEYMMRAWDDATERPVPEILVDCGSRIGFVPVTVSGKIPDCIDPEPALWKKVEEKRRDREAEFRSRREESRQQHYEQLSHPHSHHHQQQQQQQLHGVTGGGHPSQSGKIPRPTNFMDVDDMKEEKVELNFDNVDIPVVAKKKKKRKLL